MEFVTRGVERMDHLPRILAFDGGGVRGLSSLLILQEIMEDIRHRKKLDQTPKPCECFDLIGGTSTGGLIAIMLGLLGMVSPFCLTRLTIRPLRSVWMRILNSPNGFSGSTM